MGTGARRDQRALYAEFGRCKLGEAMGTMAAHGRNIAKQVLQDYEGKAWYEDVPNDDGERLERPSAHR